MKKLLMLAAMSAGMLMAGDVQQAEAGGRRNVSFSIGSGPFGNSFGLSVGRGGFNRGFNRGFGGYNRGFGGFNRGISYGGFNRGFGGYHNVGYRPTVVIAPSYGVNYGGFGYGGGFSPGCNRGW